MSVSERVELHLLLLGVDVTWIVTGFPDRDSRCGATRAFTELG